MSDMYSVMQSNGNSFYGEVVLGRFKKIYRDEENIFTKYIQGKYDPCPAAGPWSDAGPLLVPGLITKLLV